MHNLLLTPRCRFHARHWWQNSGVGLPLKATDSARAYTSPPRRTASHHHRCSGFSNAHFNSLLKQATVKAGQDPKRYSSHPIRAGGATTAANTGVPPYLVQKLGRWRSEGDRTYVKNPKSPLGEPREVCCPRIRLLITKSYLCGRVCVWWGLLMLSYAYHKSYLKIYDNS